MQSHLDLFVCLFVVHCQENVLYYTSIKDYFHCPSIDDGFVHLELCLWECENVEIWTEVLVVKMYNTVVLTVYIWEFSRDYEQLQSVFWTEVKYLLALISCESCESFHFIRCRHCRIDFLTRYLRLLTPWLQV